MNGFAKKNEVCFPVEADLVGVLSRGGVFRLVNDICVDCGSAFLMGTIVDSQFIIGIEFKA